MTFRNYLIKEGYIKDSSSETTYVPNIDERVPVVMKNKINVDAKYKAFSGNHKVKKTIKIKIDKNQITLLNSLIKMTEENEFRKELIMEFLTDDIIFKSLLNSHKALKRVIYNGFHYKWSFYEDGGECTVTVNEVIVNDNNKVLGFIDVKAVALKTLSSIPSDLLMSISLKESTLKIEKLKELLKEYQLKSLNEKYLQYNTEEFDLLKEQLKNNEYISLLSSRLVLLNSIKKDNEYVKEGLFDIFKKKEIKKFSEEVLEKELDKWDILSLEKKDIQLKIDSLKMKSLLLTNVKNNIFGLYFFYCVIKNVEKMIKFKEESYEASIHEEYIDSLDKFIEENLLLVDKYLNFLLKLENDDLFIISKKEIEEETKEKKVQKLKSLLKGSE